MVNLNVIHYFSAFPLKTCTKFLDLAEKHCWPSQFVSCLHTITLYRCVEIAKYMYTADSVVYFVEETQVLHVPIGRCSPVGRDVKISSC